MMSEYFEDQIKRIQIILKQNWFEILKIFNSYHERINFTYGIEKDNTINFLELKMIEDKEERVFDWLVKKIRL